jgi:hypothetical protein
MWPIRLQDVYRAAWKSGGRVDKSRLPEKRRCLKYASVDLNIANACCSTINKTGINQQLGAALVIAA